MELLILKNHHMIDYFNRNILTAFMPVKGFKNNQSTAAQLLYMGRPLFWCNRYINLEYRLMYQFIPGISKVGAGLFIDIEEFAVLPQNKYGNIRFFEK